MLQANYMQVVINFFQSRLCWHTSKDDEEAITVDKVVAHLLNCLKQFFLRLMLGLERGEDLLTNQGLL